MVYNEENIKLLYISKYIDVKIKNEDIAFYNYIYKIGIEIKNIANIIEFMEKGVNTQELLEFLESKIEDENAQYILDELIRCGVVE